MADFIIANNIIQSFFWLFLQQIYVVRVLELFIESS